MSIEAPTDPSGRLGWIDVARGAGILLVVIGHVVIGLVDAGLADRDGALARMNAVVYTFHMPLFFFLAGLFMPQTVARGSAAVWRGLATRIAWPYLLWSTLQLLVMAAVGANLNHEPSLSWPRWLALGWQPVSQFWFLHTLALFHVMAWLLLPRVGSLGLAWAALGLWMLPAWFSLPPVLANPCRFAIFFALGTLGLQIGGTVARTLPMLVRAAGATLAMGGCALVGLAVQSRGLIPWSPQALPAACLGTAGCLGGATLARGPVERALAALGRSSMAIYVLHILFASGTRVLLHRGAHWTDPVLLFAACLLMGLAGPLLVERGVRRLGAQRWLGLGR